MIPTTGLPIDVSHAIQLALAPVFLLTGIAGILNVIMGRLSRIVDRGRRLVEVSHADASHRPLSLAIELRNLDRRRHLVNMAITACTLSALLVCTVISILFLEVLTQLPLKWLEGILFTCSTITLVVGLAFFLHEVHLAAQTGRIEAVLAASEATAAAEPGAALSGPGARP